MRDAILQGRNSSFKVKKYLGSGIPNILVLEGSMYTVVHPLISIVAGVIILIWPTILNYVIAVWLILTGVLSYLNH